MHYTRFASIAPDARTAPRSMRSLPLAAVLLLACVALLAAPRPAQAQTTCSDPDAIWCATLTVAEIQSSGVTIGYGFVDLATDIGALSDTGFDYGGTSYTVNTFNISTGANPTLSFKLEPDGETVFADARFTLHIGTEEFSFGDASFNTNSVFRSFFWPSSGLSWSDGDMIEVEVVENVHPGSLQGPQQIVFAANPGTSEAVARCLSAPYQLRRWANRPGEIAATWSLDVLEPSGGFRNGASFTASDFEISNGQVKTIAGVNYPNQENASNVQPFGMVITAEAGGKFKSRTVQVYILESDRTDHDFANLCNQTPGVQPRRPVLTPQHAEATEGVDRHMKFRLRLNRPSPVPISVAYWTYEGTATRGIDYHDVYKRRATFAAGEQFKEVLVPILADDVADDGETVILQLSELSENANYGRFTATGTIRDAPTGPSTLYVRDTRAEEFDREMKFVVSLFPASNTAVTVDYATQDGTAEAGFDYTARSGSLTFAAGETHKTVTVPITDDTIEESDPSEFLRFRLTNPSGAPFDGGGTSLSASGIIENHETQQTTSAGQDDEAAVAENTAPTGAPTISGDATVGETLSASASGIEDMDGLDEATFAWQWIANDGNADEDIEGATSDTYTLISADEGKTIKVRATFTDDGGTEETLLSGATDAVATAADSGLTAEFTDVPASHDGSSAFTFRIAFSEDIRNGYKRMRDRILSADGGTVTRARRVDKRKDLWEITVEPSGNDTVTVTLPTGTRCGNTPCTFDKRLLSHSLSDTLAYVAPSLSVADGEDTQALSGELTATSTGGEELPDEVALLGNYPNPFNPHTTIRYALPKAGDVRLVVYDLVGHEVAVLIDEPKSAGHHTVRFDAADLPSGLYIYRLQAVDKMIARTMILVK